MIRLLACLGVLLLAASATPGLQTGNSIALGVDGGSFTINGRPRFLVFVSYFDGLDVSEANLAADFAWLKSKSVDGVRIFPNWWNRSGSLSRYAEDPLIKEDGTLDPARLARLRRLLNAAQSHRLVVDLSMSAENVRKCAGAACATKSPFVPEGTLTRDELRAGLVALAADLRRGGFANVLIDIQNEADYNSLFVSASSRAPLDASEVQTIANAIHSANPSQIVTASFSGGTSAADAASATAAAGLDVVTWHESRTTAWWNDTAANVAAMRRATTKPIYLQEPQPSNEEGWTVEGATAGLKAAIASGAAAWTFHTRSSFDMNGRSLKTIAAGDRNPNDRKFLDALALIKR